jgi:hypothetical protein
MQSIRRAPDGSGTFGEGGVVAVLDRPDASIDTCYCLSAMHVRVEEGRYVSARRESTNNAS